jgi:hypothetical protein
VLVLQMSLHDTYGALGRFMLGGIIGVAAAVVPVTGLSVFAGASWAIDPFVQFKWCLLVSLASLGGVLLLWSDRFTTVPGNSEIVKVLGLTLGLALGVGLPALLRCLWAILTGAVVVSVNFNVDVSLHHRSKQ